MTDAGGNPTATGEPADANRQAHPQVWPGHPTDRANQRPIAPDAKALRRHAVVLTVACAAALAFCAVLGMGVQSGSSQLAQRRARAAPLSADARAIVQLRQRPHQAAEAGLPQADLLARVARAMQTAQLQPQALVSTLPQPPRRLPNSEHVEAVQRLLLENVEIAALVRFCHALTTDCPALRISALHLRAAPDKESWNVDVCLSYLVLDPSLSPRETGQ